VSACYYMCPCTAIYVSACYYTYVLRRKREELPECVRMLLYMCPHTTICVSSGEEARGCPNVSACYYICVLVLLYMCPHTTTHMSSGENARSCPNVSAYYYICVLILLYMCPQEKKREAARTCPHTIIYVSAYYYICVLILLYVCLQEKKREAARRRSGFQPGALAQTLGMKVWWVWGGMCVLIILLYSQYYYTCPPHTTIYAPRLALLHVAIQCISRYGHTVYLEIPSLELSRDTKPRLHILLYMRLASHFCMWPGHTVYLEIPSLEVSRGISRYQASPRTSVCVPVILLFMCQGGAAELWVGGVSGSQGVVGGGLVSVLLKVWLVVV
jgi:hypothetical protein